MAHGIFNIDVNSKAFEELIEDLTMDPDEYFKKMHKGETEEEIIKKYGVKNSDLIEIKSACIYDEWPTLRNIKQQRNNDEWIKLEKLGHTCLTDAYPNKILWCKQEPCNNIKKSEEKVKQIIYGNACSIL